MSHLPLINPLSIEQVEWNSKQIRSTDACSKIFDEVGNFHEWWANYSNL